MNYLLAYDFGTGGIKASLYDEAGQCIADGFDGYPTYYPAAGFHEQEPEAWWQATISSTHKLVATLSDEVKQHIVGIGISGHSLGVVPLVASIGAVVRHGFPELRQRDIEAAIA